MLKFSLDTNKSEHSEIGRPWHDTKTGILACLKTLTDFLRMLSERREAGYGREERLNEFYVFGRYSLDSCGNCGRLTDYIPKEELPYIPDVLTRDEFFDYLKTYSKKGKDLHISHSYDDGVPEANLICPICSVGWTIHNCHDTVAKKESKVISLEEYVGKPLGLVKSIFSGRSDGVYFMQSDILIRNDKHIDLTPKPDYPSLKKNAKGWISEKNGVTDSYIIQKGDDGHFNVWTYFHKDCNREHLRVSEEKSFYDLFESAGFKHFELTSIPNQYCPCESCRPWFKVQTEFGEILIGWRKSVINIDWSGLNLDLLHLFKEEEVTKSSTYIHAWGWDKAKDYLSRIIDHLISQ